MKKSNKKGRALDNNITDETILELVKPSIPSQSVSFVSELKSLLLNFGIPFTGLFLLSAALIGVNESYIANPWAVADVLCDSSQHAKSKELKMKMLDEAGMILHKQITLHPYHARVWAIYGRYFILNNKFDSCIYADKKALELGNESPINSIVEIAEYDLGYAISQKLEPIYSQTDSALKIIQSAEVPGYEVRVLKKLRGNVYLKMNDFEKSTMFFESYIKWRPNDFDVLYNLALLYSTNGKMDKAMEYYDRAKNVNPTNPKLQNFFQNTIR